MNNRAADGPIVNFSLTIYRSLLIAYPDRFRREYGSDMLQLFRDCCLRAVRQNEKSAFARLWARTLLDFIRSVPHQYMQKEAYMSRSQFIQVSGVALILSSLAYVIPDVSFGAWVIASLLLAVGILGLRARFGAGAGAFGRNVLLAGVIGVCLLYAAIGVVYVGQTYLGWTQFEGTATFNPDSLWVVLFSGPLFPLVALTLFGVAALQRKLMQRWNWLPLATGVWFPALYIFLAAYIFGHYGAFPDRYWNLIFPVLLMQFFTLCLLGAVLVFDRVREVAPA